MSSFESYIKCNNVKILDNTKASNTKNCNCRDKETFPITRKLSHFCAGTMTTQAESINSDQQRVLNRGLRHTILNTEQNQLAITYQQTTNTTAPLVVKYQ